LCSKKEKSSDYFIFGLRLQSNQPIPWLVASEEVSLAPDVKVWLGEKPPWLNEILREPKHLCSTSPYLDDYGESVYKVWGLAGGIYVQFQYSDGTEFWVDRLSTEIWATWSNSTTIEDTMTYLIGPVLGFVLQLRGTLSLHGSAISVGDQAIGFVGPAGAGKSTLAAAFARQGYPVLSEDILPVFEKHNALFIGTGYPYVCLWPDTVKSLFGSSNALPRLTPTEGKYASWDKRYLSLTKDGYPFKRQTYPLGMIYLLGERSNDSKEPLIEQLPLTDGLMALIANLYVGYLLDEGMHAQAFRLLGRLVALVTIRRVSIPANLSCLPRICGRLVDDIHTWVTTPTDFNKAYII